MTLLAIARDAATELNLARPAGVAAGSSQDARRLSRSVNKMGRTIAQAADWSYLRAERVFSATGLVAQDGVLPADFGRMVPETVFDRSTARAIEGPTDAADWQAIQASASPSTARPVWALRGGVLSILPAPAAGVEIAFEYVSTHWCQGADGAGKAAMDADTDVARIDAELLTTAVIADYLQSVGRPAGAAFALYEQRLRRLKREDRPRPSRVRALDIALGGSFDRGG